VVYRKYTYIMLNKPDGVVSATEDGNTPTVLDLLPETLQKIGLFPCGRLDKNTLGLLLLTNNGPLAHAMLSPAHHVKKTYRFRCEKPLSPTDVDTLTRGVDIGEKSSTRPAEVRLITPSEGEITVTEGKYHQIKRMFSAIGNEITYLERITFADIPLDPSLDRGEWRFLSPEEIAVIESKG
ncbi:MAG: pseudouridine synthase, partial [Ruminococcus sp.]|nr:pseudouridine synthase [Candidatus Apopatosoma intestinale]